MNARRFVLAFMVAILMATLAIPSSTVHAQVACYEGQEYTEPDGTQWKFLGGTWNLRGGNYKPSLLNPPCGPGAVSVPVAPSAAPSSTNGDAATFVTDVTIADGTKVNANQAFTKTWRLKNSGTSTWNGYVFQVPTQNVNVPLTKPGETADISVTLTAPATNGPYKVYGQLANNQGVKFGPSVYVFVIVENGTGPTTPYTAPSTGQQIFPSSLAGQCVTQRSGNYIQLCQTSGVPVQATVVADGTYTIAVGQSGVEKVKVINVCSKGFTIFGKTYGKTCSPQTVPASPASWLPPATSVTQSEGTTTYQYGSGAALVVQRLVIKSLDKAAIEAAAKGAGAVAGSTISIVAFEVGAITYMQAALIPPTSYAGVPAVGAPPPPFEQKDIARLVKYLLYAGAINETVRLSNGVIMKVNLGTGDCGTIDFGDSLDLPDSYYLKTSVFKQTICRSEGPEGFKDAIQRAIWEIESFMEDFPHLVTDGLTKLYVMLKAMLQALEAVGAFETLRQFLK